MCTIYPVYFLPDSFHPILQAVFRTNTVAITHDNNVWINTEEIRKVRHFIVRRTKLYLRK